MATSKEYSRSGSHRTSGFTMEIDDQAFLDQIEQNIRGRENEQDVAQREAEQRAKEMERIRQASANIPKPGTGKPVEPQKKNPHEDDPRYKEYFERLRRQKGEAPRSPASAIPAAPAQATPAKGTESQVVGPGAIVRFDDGSIGVYKDAVSGRDYALFYFLRPDGQFEPEGVFLQCYQAKVLGNLPENYFAELREKSEWDRDLILFHLSKFEHVSLLNNVAEHEDRKPKHTTPVRQTAPSAAVQGTPVAEKRETEPSKVVSPEVSQQSAQQPAASATPPRNDTLVKGRKFTIVFGGKKWEAVYWTSDENGAIVAHSTHGDWSLMRLELDRFKDSLVLGEIVDTDTMNTIAESATGS